MIPTQHGIAWEEPTRGRKGDMAPDACGETPQEKCRSGLYAVVRAKVSYATFWAVLGLLSVLLFAVVWYSVGRADAACDKAAIASEKVAKVEQQFETLSGKMDLILAELAKK